MTQIGVLLPSRETAMTGAHDAAGLIGFARAAEDAGFDSVWIGDSPLARTRVDPLPVLAAVAATTSRIRVGTAAFTATLRHPLLGAHTAATVDQLSGGRLILGLGAGFPVPESRDEFAAMDISFEERVGRRDETVRQYYRRSLDDMSMIQAYFGGSAAECAQWLGRYLDAGAEHLVVRIGSLDARRQLDLLAETLLPALRSVTAG